MNMKKVTELPENYKPSSDEEYMNELQLEYFRAKLIDWKLSLSEEAQQTVKHLKEESWSEPDAADQAAIVTSTSLELRTRDRYRKLIDKIDAAIARIEKGVYGFCQETGEPIGLKRLEARPIATMSIEAQERHEKFERSHSEDE
jgi:DnaK suppressor protein